MFKGSVRLAAMGRKKQRLLTTGEGYSIDIPLKGADGGKDFRSRRLVRLGLALSLLPPVLAFDTETFYARTTIGRLTQVSEHHTFDELFHS